MTQMDHPEIEIIELGPQDNFRSRSPRRDSFQDQYPRRPNQRGDDGLSRKFQRLEVGSKKNKAKDKRKSIDVEGGMMIRRRSSGGEKRLPRYYEFYRFEKRSEDWNVADKIQIRVSQDELEKKVEKEKGKTTVLGAMTKMNSLRRGQIDRLLVQKNDAEREKDAEWVPVLIKTTEKRGTDVLAFDIIIAKSFKPGGPMLRTKRNSFVGEKSDLREPIKSRGRDADGGWGREKSRDKAKDKDKYGGERRNDHDHDHDPFDNVRLFASDGKPIDNNGGSFKAQTINRQPLPMEHPIAGPTPGFQPIPPLPITWNDPMRPGDFPADVHPSQPPVEILNDHQFPHDGHAGNGILDLDQLLEKPQVSGGAHQDFKQPRLNDFPGAGPVDFRPNEPERPRSGGRRKSESRPRPNRIYTGQSPQRRREHSRRNHHGDSSIDDNDEENSIFFDRDERSSMSSYSDEHERFIQRRGSLKWRPSTRRGESVYREHHRRGGSHNSGRRDLFIEPARTPRRSGLERRQTISYPEPPRITYPSRNRRDRDVIDEPLSPVLIQGPYSPTRLRRRESRGTPPEMFYPDELIAKDRWAEDYINATEPQNRYRDQELRRLDKERESKYREEDVRRQERELDAKDRRRGGKEAYREYRDYPDYHDY